MVAARLEDNQVSLPPPLKSIFPNNLIEDVSTSLADKCFYPITYGILTFRQLRGRGGGLFGPDPEYKVTVNRLI